MAVVRSEGKVGSKHVTASGQQAQVALDWLSWADRDYLAARSLLLDNFLVQGTGLANTAIEKYIKAIIGVRGQTVPRGHDVVRLYQSVKRDGKLQLDEDFLALLVKAYKLRYPDELSIGFNIVLSQALILAALDESVLNITSCFSMTLSDGQRVKRVLDHLIEIKDPRILKKNVALKTIASDELLGQPSTVYELRVVATNARLEADYVTAKISDASFRREALLQKSDRQFELSSPPIQ